MTATDNILTPPSGSPSNTRRLATPARLEVRWSCTAVCVSDRLLVASSATSLQPGPHDRADIVIAVNVLNDERAMVEVWIDSAPERSTLRGSEDAKEANRIVVMPARSAPCSVHQDGDMIHVDVRAGDARTLAVTLGPDERVLYAQSDLIAELTHGGGRYDPPTATRYAIERQAARA